MAPRIAKVEVIEHRQALTSPHRLLQPLRAADAPRFPDRPGLPDAPPPPGEGNAPPARPSTRTHRSALTATSQTRTLSSRLPEMCERLLTNPLIEDYEIVQTGQDGSDESA